MDYRKQVEQDTEYFKGDSYITTLDVGNILDDIQQNVQKISTLLDDYRTIEEHNDDNLYKIIDEVERLLVALI